MTSWKPTTTRTEHRFTVKEGADGALFIMLERGRAPALPVLGDGFLSFDLREGTTLAQAQQLARMVNASVVATAYTGTRL